MTPRQPLAFGPATEQKRRLALGNDGGRAAQSLMRVVHTNMYVYGYGYGGLGVAMLQLDFSSEHPCKQHIHTHTKKRWACVSQQRHHGGQCINRLYTHINTPKAEAEESALNNFRDGVIDGVKLPPARASKGND